MPIFCYRCRDCQTTHEDTARVAAMDCTSCEGLLTRDYKAENIVTSIPLHMSSRNTSNKSDFLPTAKDFEAPGDPTGEKGMQNWKNTHQLKDRKTWV